MKMIFVLVGASLMLTSPAMGKTVTVTVDAKTGPWSVKVNPKMPYGVGDARDPVVIAGIEPDSGKIEIYPDGKITVNGKAFDSVGDQNHAVDDGAGKKKKRFPSFYTPKILYPAYAHGLVATFVNASGEVVSRPVMVGTGIRIPIPPLATGLSLGVNDDTFARNSGAFSVRLVLPDD